MRLRHIRFFPILLLSACTTYPLGMDEAAWLALTPAQQLDAQARQADLSLQKDEMRSRERIALAEIEAERERAYFERIDRIKASARPNDTVVCVVESATVDFKPGWHRTHPVAALLVRGERREIVLQPSDGHQKEKSAWMWFAGDGTQAALCLQEPESETPRGRDCFVVAGTTKDFAAGVELAIPQSDWFKGSFRCQSESGRPHGHDFPQRSR